MRIFIIILSILFFNQLFSLRLPDGNEAMVSKLKKFPDGKIEYVKLSELVEISLEQEGISYINSEEIWFDKYGNYRKLKGVGSIFSFIIDEFMVGADISEVEFYENKKIKTLGFKRNVSKITNTKKEEDDSEYYVFNYNKEEAIEEIDNYPKINLFDQVCEIKSISLYENQKLMRIVFNSAFYYTDSCNDHTPIYEMFFYPDDNSEHTNYEYYDIRRKKVMFLSTSQEDYIKIDIGNSIIKAKQVLFYRNGTPMYLLLKGNNNNLLYFFNILLSNYLTNNTITLESAYYEKGVLETFDTPVGLIKAKEVMFYPDKKIAFLICDELSYVDTPIGAVGINTISFHLNGKIKAVELPTPEEINSPLGKIFVSYIEWDENGKLKKVKYAGEKNKKTKYKYGDIINFK